LPPNLETMNLRLILRRNDEWLLSGSGSGSRIDNALWISHFIHLVRNAETKLPSLKNIGILIHGRDWPESEDGSLFEEVRKECSYANLKLRIMDEPFGTKVSYFQEQTKDWWLGRDRWYQRKPINYIH
jgi:hypothetical protein